MRSDITKTNILRRKIYFDILLRKKMHRSLSIYVWWQIISVKLNIPHFLNAILILLRFINKNIPKGHTSLKIQFNIPQLFD